MVTTIGTKGGSKKGLDIFPESFNIDSMPEHNRSLDSGVIIYEEQYDR